MKSSGFAKSANNRVYTGFIGETPAHIVDEYVFNSLDDFEKAITDMAQPQFKQYAEQISTIIIPGSQKWQIYKIVD